MYFIRILGDLRVILRAAFYYNYLIILEIFFSLRSGTVWRRFSSVHEYHSEGLNHLRDSEFIQINATVSISLAAFFPQTFVRCESR